MPDTFEFFGETFTLNGTHEYEWAALEFAEAATGNSDLNPLESSALVMTLLRAAIVTEDWQRFRVTARSNKAQTERDLMPIVVRIFSQSAERPTQRPSDSSAGPSVTEPKSVAVSSSPAPLRAVERLEAEGRPDKAYIVELAQREMASAG